MLDGRVRLPDQRHHVDRSRHVQAVPQGDGGAMRRDAKADANQPEIVEKLRDIPGVSVEPIHRLGQGKPDLLIGYRQRNYLIELKNGNRPCDRVLTPDESKWHARWRGQVVVAGTFEEICDVLGIEVAR
jgi:hypothetical protein